MEFVIKSDVLLRIVRFCVSLVDIHVCLSPLTFWAWRRCLGDSDKHLPSHSSEKFKSVCWSHKLSPRCSRLARFASRNLIILFTELSPVTFSSGGSCEYFAATKRNPFCGVIPEQKTFINFVEALLINTSWVYPILPARGTPWGG